MGWFLFRMFAATVASMIQHVWSIATPARNGSATAAVTPLAGESTSPLIWLTKALLKLKMLIFVFSVILWTTWWGPNVRRWRCTRTGRWERRFWSAITAAAVMSSCSDSSRLKPTLLWCFCAGEAFHSDSNSVILGKVYFELVDPNLIW